MGRVKLEQPNFTLSKRNDGYYDIRYQWDAETKTKATGTKDPKEAEKFRAQFASDWAKPKRNGNVTVTAVLEMYWEYNKDSIKQPVSAAAQIAHIKRISGNLRAALLTQSDIDAYAKVRLSEKRKNGAGTISEGTVSKELNYLRAALNHATAQNVFERTVTFRKPTKGAKARDGWIDRAEAARIVQNASPHVALFVQIALATAKRREAILQLKWDAVDLTEGREKISFGDDIGNKRRGNTPITGRIALITNLKLAKSKSVSEFVIEFRGAPVLDVKRGLKMACERAGVKVITSHVLKHSSITWMVQHGVSLEHIANFTNTSKQMIERVYGHHSPAYLKVVSDALDF